MPLMWSLILLLPLTAAGPQPDSVVRATVEVSLQVASGEELDRNRVARCEASFYDTVVILTYDAASKKYRGSTPMLLSSLEEHPLAEVSITGRGFADQSFTLRGGADGLKVTGTHTVSLWKGRQSLRLIRAKDNSPLSDMPISVCVRRFGGNQFSDFEQLNTNAEGLLEIANTEFPFEVFFPNSDPKLDMPHRLRPLIVHKKTDAPVTVVVRSVPVVRMVLSPPIVAHIQSVAKNRRTLFQLLPLEPMSGLLRGDWSTLRYQLSEAAISAVTTDGSFPLTGLPQGLYLAVLAVGSRGVAHTVFRHGGYDDQDVRLRFGQTQPLSLAPEDLGKDARFVIDGYIPHTMVETFLHYDSFYRDGLVSTGLFASVTDKGAVLHATNSANPHLTVLTTDNQIRHVPKPGVTAKLEADGEVSGQVKDVQGRSVVDAAVNLTSLFGGELGLIHLNPRTVEMRELTTDGSGKYVIRGVHPGSYLLSVSQIVRANEGRSRRFEYLRSSLRVVQVAPGANQVDLKLDQAGVECHCGKVHLFYEH